jgi:hypothetical protein
MTVSCKCTDKMWAKSYSFVLLIVIIQNDILRDKTKGLKQYFKILFHKTDKRESDSYDHRIVCLVFHQ